MPQPPSPNMLIVWPTDNDDADAWAPIMDTAIRQVIDSHNHSGGSGVKVPTAGLKIDADVSWAFGGAQFAITDLRAIDFSPQPASGMAALAGALFLNAADNELYYRTFGGTNVKMTSGAALNVVGFSGGIGGDYSAVGALVVFDDGTDAYWFEQQIGAAVRQFAKMRCSDIQLYEFKAVGTTPVPNQAVTLKSPAALAAGYTLTFPGALPGSSGTLIQSDNTGILSFSNAGLVLSTPTITNATLSDATVPTGHILTVTDGAATLKGMSYTTTRAFGAGDFAAVSGSAVTQNAADHHIGVTTGSTTIARYPFPNPWGSHQTLTGITIEFYNDGVSVNRVTPTLKYIDPAVNPLTLNTVTGLSFGVSGHTLVMSGTPSISLQGVAERIFLLEFVGNTGGSTMVSMTTTVTT